MTVLQEVTCPQLERERAGKIERHVESQLDVEMTAEMAAIKMETTTVMRKMMMGTLVMVIEMMTMVSMVVVMVVVRQFLVAKLGGCQKSLVRNSTWVA